MLNDRKIVSNISVVDNKAINKSRSYQMNNNSNEKLLIKLESMVKPFDSININDIDHFKTLKYSKIKNEDLLTLITLAKDNSRSLNILIKYYYPFIVSVASNYYIKGISLEDVLASAVEGFINGVKKYDGNQVLNLHNLFYPYIIKSINKEIGLQFTSAKIGDNNDYVVFKYLKYCNMVSKCLIEELSYNDLLEYLKCDSKCLKRLINLINREDVTEINHYTNGLISNDDYGTREILITILRKYIPTKYFNIFGDYYGLFGDEYLKENEIAQKYGLSSSGIGYIIKRCLEILKSSSALKELEEYFYTDCLTDSLALKKRLRETNIKNRKISE